MDDLTPKQRHKNMRRIKSKNTKAEILLRKTLWNHGYRYRKNYKGLPGKPDIVLIKYRICVFVDGEYFHGKDWNIGRREKVAAGNNAQYWLPKIERNIQRDREIDAELKGLGWRVLRFWSRDVLKNTNDCFATVEAAIFDQIIDSDWRSPGGD